MSSTYEIVARNKDTMEVSKPFETELGEHEILFVIHSDKIKCEGNILNMRYRSDGNLHQFSPEISVLEVIGGERVVEGDLRIEIYNDVDKLVGVREERISNLGHNVLENHGFGTYVKFDGYVTPTDISEIHVFIECEEIE